MKKTAIVQDDSREARMAEMFGLKREGGRIGVDGVDEKNNEYELKTTTKSSISTARDLGLNHIDKWRGRYWIIQPGINDKDDGFKHIASYFLAPEHMEEWYSKIEKILLADIELRDTVLEELRLGDLLPEKLIARVGWLMHRGKLMNDPNIPMTYVRENGIIIKNDDPLELQKLVGQYPITHKVKQKTHEKIYDNLWRL